MTANHKTINVVQTLDIPKGLTPWLTAKGSLTAMLESKAGQPLRVERAFEGYRLLTLIQKKQLGWQGSRLGQPMMAWVREALLYGNDKLPWVSACSIIPITSLQGEARRLQYLRSVPIGYVLFARQATLPSYRTIQYNKADNGEANKAGEVDNSLEGWQRQTRYNWHGRPLLISETFLAYFKP